MADEVLRGCRLDCDGFLSAPQQWSEQVAQALAEREGLRLRDEQWRVIRMLREHYVNTQTVPTMREVQQATGFSVRALFELFPAGGPLMQGVKIAGLPKPSGCK